MYGFNLNVKLIAKQRARVNCQLGQEISIRPNELAIIVEQSFQNSRANCVAVSGNTDDGMDMAANLNIKSATFEN